MSFSAYQIRQCENPACGLRYPLPAGHPFGKRCPLCLGPTQVALQRALHPDQTFSPASAAAQLPKGADEPLDVLLDNIRSGWNVGAIFRTADGLGLGHLYLCGITPTPENETVRKTALGAERSVPWSSHKNALTLAETQKAAGRQLWALEQDERAVPVSSVTDLSAAHPPITLIVGNEITGVDPALLDLCDRILYIPLRGQKRSLNVEVALGVALGQLNH